MAMEDAKHAILPAEFFDVKQESQPKASHRVLVVAALGIYVVLALVFVAIMDSELTTTETEVTTTLHDRTGEGLRRRRRGALARRFTRRGKSRIRCNMLVRTSGTYEFESSEVEETGEEEEEEDGSAMYAYMLASVQQTGPECERELAFGPCVDASIYVVEESTPEDEERDTGVVDPVAIATDAAGDLYAYSRGRDEIWRYEIDEGLWGEVFDDEDEEVPIVDRYAIAVDGTETIWMVCSGDAAFEGCGLMAIDIETEAVSQVVPRGSFPDARAVAVSGDVVWVADFNRGIYRYRRGDLALIEADFSPKSLAVSSSSVLWALGDAGGLFRCGGGGDFSCLTDDGVDDPLGADAVAIAPLTDDDGVYVVYDDSRAVGKYVANSSATTLVFEALRDTPRAIASTASMVFMLHDDVVNSFSVFTPGENETHKIVFHEIQAGWFSCGGTPVTTVSLELADAEAYARQHACSGHVFRAVYDFYLPERILATAVLGTSLRDGSTLAEELALRNALEDCETLDVEREICDTVAQQPPYLCRYHTHDSWSNAIATAAANTQFFFACIVFVVAYLLSRSCRLDSDSAEKIITATPQKEERKEEDDDSLLAKYTLLAASHDALASRVATVETTVHNMAKKRVTTRKRRLEPSYNNTQHGDDCSLCTFATNNSREAPVFRNLAHPKRDDQRAAAASTAKQKSATQPPPKLSHSWLP